MPTPSAAWKWPAVGVTLAAVLAAATWTAWTPPASRWVRGLIGVFRPHSPENSGTEDGEQPHDHGHPDHDVAFLELSPQALRNIGLTDERIQPVRRRDFTRTVTVPGLVVEQPGRTRLQVATPLTGVVIHVHAVEGEALQPGALLFRIRLTHEDLVQAQFEFLRTLGELDVEQQEIDRLEEVTRSGAVAGRLLLERQYAKDKLTASLSAQREALRLHGLSSDQVEQIASKRRLLRELEIFAPAPDRHPEHELHTARPTAAGDLASATQPASPQPASAERGLSAEEDFSPGDGVSDEEDSSALLVLEELHVHKGQSLKAGEQMCSLTDYRELFIEGRGFEEDIARLQRAYQKQLPVAAAFGAAGKPQRVLEDLRISYLASRVDPDSRTFRFFVLLPNTMLDNTRTPRSIQWQYVPGQRMQLRIPVETWRGQFVLPIDAVAREGAEYFVFRQDGPHFDRLPVHVMYRDQFEVVLANDGSFREGDRLAMAGAHQMQIALKNKSGGGIDPHAGHSH